MQINLPERVKVNLEYPLSDTYVKLGEILIHNEKSNTYHGENCDMAEEIILRYPHIFKSLKWYEERKQEDLPVYVKKISTNEVYKVKKYSAGGFYDEFNHPHYSCSSYEPSTEEAYLVYRKTLQ